MHHKETRIAKSKEQVPVFILVALQALFGRANRVPLLTAYFPVVMGHSAFYPLHLPLLLNLSVQPLLAILISEQWNVPGHNPGTLSFLSIVHP